MQLYPSIRVLVFIWLAWAITLIGFQTIVPMRYAPQRPDYVLSWTPGETGIRSQNNKPMLREPFLNSQVSWDSEFYLSIALKGYDDPDLRAITSAQGQRLTLNYAFFPFYPMVVRVVAFPVQILGLTPLATATLAGVLVSLLGTLAAMFALYVLARDELHDAGGVRAAFYLLIFPMGFFLAQVYSEGLFIGLAFGALALLKRQQWLLAAIGAGLAAWTRAVGVALVIPFVLAWWNDARAEAFTFSRSLIAKGLLALTPLAATLVWKFSFLGYAHSQVEEKFFSRGFLEIGQTLASWASAFATLSQNPQAQVYYGVEMVILALALVACLATFRHEPGIALFGLAVLTISFFSGVAQSVGRYALAIPSLYLWLSHLGRHEAFDRAWTTASLLLMGMLATLFSFDFWVN